MLDHPYLPSTWLPYLAIVSQFLGAISWPLAIVVLGIAFKKDLAALVNRVTGFKVAGADVTFSNQSDQPLLEQPTGQELKTLSGLERTPAIAHIERQLHQTFEQFPTADRFDLAIRLLAQARLETAYAIVHSAIFGSQIALLEKIRAAGSVDRKFVEDYFEKLKSEYDFYGDKEVDGYLHFLFSKELIRDIDGEISLTDYGDDYLLFVWRARLPKDNVF